MDSIFLKGVIETAKQADKTAQDIIKQFDEDRLEINKLGKGAATALMVHHSLKKHPISSASKIEKHCNITLATTIKALNHLEKLGIVKEITGKARNRIYTYKKYLDILSEGTEPLKD